MIRFFRLGDAGRIFLAMEAGNTFFVKDAVVLQPDVRKIRGIKNKRDSLNSSLMRTGFLLKNDFKGSEFSSPFLFALKDSSHMRCRRSLMAP